MSTMASGQKGWELGGWLGVSNYFGDLNDRIYLGDVGLAGGLNARYNFNTRICTKGSLSYGRISAEDADSPNNFERSRNLSFKSSVIDFTGTIEFNFFEYVHGTEDQYYTPYLLGGFSIFRFNPKAELNGQTYSLRDMGTEGQAQGSEYGSISGGLTIGGGMKWDINDKWSFNVEFSYRNLFTDYLDDVSTTYPDLVQLAAQRGPEAALLSDRSLMDGIGVPGRQRGNSKDNDTYTFFGISIMRYFGRLECPKISDF